jgi:hypothetical protein
MEKNVKYLENSGLKEWHDNELLKFSFCQMYSEFEADKVSNSETAI